MPTIATPDGTASVVVSLAQFAVCRMVLDMEAEQLEAFKRLLALGPEHIRALCDVAKSQLQLEGLLADAPEPAPLPTPRNGRLVFPIACEPRIEAERTGGTMPTCAWKRERDGAACVVCGCWMGELTDRGAFLIARFAANETSQ